MLGDFSLRMWRFNEVGGVRNIVCSESKLVRKEKHKNGQADNEQNQ